VSGQRILRVTVRGRFGELGDHATAYLRSNQDEHDVSRSSYTTEGTLTYDSLLDFFSIRYEVRVGARDSDELAAEYTISEAEQFLGTMGFDYRGLRTTVSDPTAAWSGRAAHGAPLQACS
jgi:hypothetical protein